MRNSATINSAAVVAATALVVGTVSAHASCPGQTVTQTCAAAASARYIDLGSFLASDPTYGRADTRLDGRPWIADAWNPAPFAMNPEAEDHIALQGSLAHLGRYESAVIARKIEEAAALAPKDLKLPKPPVARIAPVDMWGRLDVTGVNASDAATATRGSVGADLRLGKRTVAGLAVAFDESPSAVAGPSSAASGRDVDMAAYVAFKLGSAITLDARALLGEATAGADARQAGVVARVVGEWSFANLKLASAASLAHGVDMASGETSGTVERNTLSLAPRISRPFTLSDGAMLEPFVRVQADMQFANGLETGVDAGSSRTAGAGVTWTDPGSYAVSITTDVVDSDAAAAPDLKSRFELKVPLE